MATRRAAARRPSSVGGLIDYARCPKRFYWSTRPPAPSLRRAERAHRHRGPPLDRDDLAGPGHVARARRRPRTSRSRSSPARPARRASCSTRSARAGSATWSRCYAERPFLLPIEGVTIKGRIDAIYGAPDGPWEVVDYKTGRPPADEDPLAACSSTCTRSRASTSGASGPRSCRLTYLYLATDEERSHGVDDVEAGSGRASRSGSRGSRRRRSRRRRDPQCRWCDFLAFCDAGKAWVAANADVGPDGGGPVARRRLGRRGRRRLARGEAHSCCSNVR